MGFGQPIEEPRKPGEILFHPIKPRDYNLPKHAEQNANMFGFRPCYKQYQCGACGAHTNGRVLCDLIRTRDSDVVSWCICGCGQEEPTLIIESKEGEGMVTQFPVGKEYHAASKWPSGLAELYEEASRAFSARAFTASTMVCRKLLMVCACMEGDGQDKSFAQYVDYIVTNVLTLERARKSVDDIRKIGNAANHEVAFVTEQDARRVLDITTYLLNSLYQLPNS